MIDFALLAQECAPTVAPQTLAAIVSVESDLNPYAIGVVDGYLPRQPESYEEAVATAHALSASGWNYSVGLAQINVHNLKIYHLSVEEAFQPCTNLRVGSEILVQCFVNHPAVDSDPQTALRDALSCYYSGNYHRGHRPEFAGLSYVERVTSRLKH